jgi:predicted DNA binding CopG/RHH family protein
MNKPQFDQEEKELLDSYERGEWNTVEDLEGETRRFREYARATFRKDARVNIRISSKDLDALKKKAMEEGIPYQTLMTSILHKYVSGRLTERP